MNRLKNLLQSNYFYAILFILLLVYILVSVFLIKYNSLLSGKEKNITGEIIYYNNKDDKLYIELKSKEKIIVNYYYKENEKRLNNLYGKKIYIEGELTLPKHNTMPNTFDYKNYLYNNKIFYIFNANKIKILNNNFNIRNVLINRVEKISSSKYLKLFLLGDKSELEKDDYAKFQENGIAHLLAISGLHVNIFILILDFLLEKIKCKNKFFFISFFLVFYSWLTNFTVSILRCVIFYILKNILSIFNIKISNIKILFLVATILILYNPFYIYDLGFLYSFIITFYLMNIVNNEKNGYIKKSLSISFVSFLASLPITANICYQFNLSSILFNLVFVPFVSVIIFPLSIIVFIFPILSFLLNIFTNILEILNTFSYNYLSIFIDIPKINIVLISLYYVSLYLYLKENNKFILSIIFILIFNKVICYIDNNYYVYYLDIGQGDSALLISPYKEEIILIDTGGNYNYSVSDNTILFLKSIGISKIDILVLTHGDSDHALETSNINKKIDIKNIIFNNNALNTLEKKIKKLDIKETKKIDLKYFNSNNLNDNTSNENDASLVFYFNINNYNFLFTGDISTKPLLKIVNKYNMNIDFFKVPHHGSKNNLSKEILSKINPKYSIISAGKNNMFHHPSDEVIDMLEESNSKIFTTAIDGTVKITVDKDKYSIKTYEP